MSGRTVRITRSTHATLKAMASQSGKSMQQVLDEAVEQMKRARFFDEMNAAFAKLKADPKAWAEELAERRAWESTLRDGLEDA